MNELITLGNTLNAMVECYTREKVIDEYSQFNKFERISGVAKIKLILTAVNVMSKEDFNDFKIFFNIDAPFISKCKKAETPIRLIELCDNLNIETFSTTQLIEMSAISPDKLAGYLLDGTITPITTCAEIRELTKVVDDIINAPEELDESEDDAEVVENECNTPIEVKQGLGVVSIKVSDIKKMLDCNNIVDLKKMLGSYVSNINFAE